MSFSTTIFDREYYDEHAASGLNYLGHGSWQIDYGKWFVDCLNLEGDRVLDLGCACGSIAAGLSKAGACVTGCDVNEHMINLGRARFPEVDLRICDGSNLHYWKDGTFSAVHSAQVFEHFKPKSVPGILAEINRVLAPGGLLISFLDTTELFTRQNRSMESGKEDPTHTCIMPIDWWIDQLNQNGFKRFPEIENVLKSHPGSFFRRYDWDFFVARKQ